MTDINARDGYGKTHQEHAQQKSGDTDRLPEIRHFSDYPSISTGHTGHLSIFRAQIWRVCFLERHHVVPNIDGDPLGALRSFHFHAVQNGKIREQTAQP